jgi:3-phenylpropionate/trans-cinnamate dioxygenase ferredoxin reductase component
MGDLHVKYLLVGGGLASFSAAAAIRRRDAQGSVMLVGQEINRPYNRAALSKAFLRRQEARSALFTCEPDWYSSHAVQLRTGCRAAHLDSARSVVTLESGDAVSYDRLLLATGCSMRALNIPGQHLANVFAPRAIEDYEQVLSAMNKARTEGHKHGSGRGLATVIGGGLLGVEIAAGIAEAGLAVDLVAGGAYPWAKFAGEATGRFLSRFLSDHGVRIHAGAHAQRIDGDGRAQRVILADGAAVECDFVVAAAGTNPNKELLRGTGIIAEHAILTDEHCRTNVADIWAAGDCAAVRDPVFGKHRAPEQWDGAAATGTVAGTNMAGGDSVLEAVASISTEAFGLKIRGWGTSRHVARRVIRGSPNVESPDFVEIGITSDNRVAQVLAVGPQGENPILQELIRRRVTVGGHDESLSDPAWPLENLLA